MKRIRNLGLAAVMALALTATVGAASASASAFVADEYGEYGAYVNGDSGGQEWQAFGAAAQCGASHFSLAALAEPSSTLAATTLTNPNCELLPSGNYAPFKFNGCSFVFHTGEETKWGGFSGTVDIGPAGCGPMTVEYSRWCPTWSFYPGTGFPGWPDLPVEFTNEGTGSKATVRAEVELVGIETQMPGVGCSSGKITKEGKYFGNWTLKAENELGEAIGLRVE